MEMILTVHNQVIFTGTVFLLTYVLIVTEKVHRMVAALCGAALVVLAGVLTAGQATEHIDFNTIGLLTGMMIIVGITRQTGFFEYLAIKAARAARGEPLSILAALSLVTAVLSALLDNVTTVLLIVPVTFAIARRLEVNPLPFLVAEIICSNIGGTATLIGDPPNIMIGSAVGLGFVDFVINLAPVVVVIYAFTVFCLLLIYRRELTARPELKTKINRLNELDEIKDYSLLRLCLLVLGLTITGFTLHQFLHLESSTVALSGATLLLLLSRSEPEHALQAVEWPVLFFFTGLFVLVGALQEVGIIEAVARLSLNLTGGKVLSMGMLILWISALASALIDNIPFVAAMIPLIQNMGRLGGLENLNFLWWSLALGACLGGNGTIIGASANVLVAGMAEKRGYLLGFIDFFKVAFPLMLMSVLVANIYLLACYLLDTGAVRMVALGTGLVLYAGLGLWSRSLRNKTSTSTGRV